MFEKLNHIIADAGSRLDQTAHRMVDRLTRFAGSLVVMLVFGLLAAAALLALCASAVVALAPTMGTAGALASIGAGLLVTSVIVLLATSRGIKGVATAAPDLTSAPGINASTSLPTPGLKAHQTSELKPLPATTAETPTGLESIVDLARIDPLLVTAAAGAALALFGPRRIARVVARATAAAALTRTIAPLVPSAIAGLSNILNSARPPSAPTPAAVGSSKS